jgi:hypothetical protein
LVLQFKKRRVKCESIKRTTDGCQTPSDGKSSCGLQLVEVKSSIDIILLYY